VIAAIAHLRRLSASLPMRLLVTGVLLALAVWQLDLAGVGARLKAIAPLPACIGVCALLVGQAISGLRWREIAAACGLHGSHRWFTSAYLRGCFYSVLLPTGIGGDATRVLLARRLGSTGAATRSVMADRLTGLAALTLTAMALAPFAGYGLALGLSVALGAAGVVLGGVAVLLARRRRLGRWLAWTLLYEAIWFAGVWLLGEAIHVGLPAFALPAIILIVGVAMALPISIGGTGAREAGFVLALAPLGIGAAPAVALGVTFGAALALVGLCGALVPLERPATLEARR
jgi:uncharacterized membrane protein YbhN (UPF0104 family)